MIRHSSSNWLVIKNTGATDSTHLLLMYIVLIYYLLSITIWTLIILQSYELTIDCRIRLLPISIYTTCIDVWLSLHIDFYSTRPLFFGRMSELPCITSYQVTHCVAPVIVQLFHTAVTCLLFSWKSYTRLKVHI